MTLYTSPAGEFETLSVIAGGGGWTLADKSGTVYTFAQPSGLGFLLSQITDREQHKQVLHYTGGKLDTVTDQVSGRALHVTWTADGRHVAQVATDPVTGTDQTTALTWTYTYDQLNPDQLAKVCAPPAGTNTSPSCTTYSYTAGSHFRSAVLDSTPASYWRLSEASNTTAASEVLENLGNDNATYSAQGVTLGAAGPLTTAGATGASFNGTSGSVTLPNATLKNTYLALGVWFKTTSPGVLVGYQNTALTSAPSHASSPLYVGTDGKLRGELYGPNIGFNPITTSTTVTDGAWHYAVLSGAGDTQTLYLDGTAVGSVAGAIDHLDTDFTYLGAGYTQGIPWPAAPAASTGGNNYFNGQLAEVAVYQHALGAPAVAAQYAAGKNASTELTGVTLPSTKTKLKVTYDPVKDRATQVTDANGSNWTINSPSASGSSQEYRSSVMGANPAGYWRLSDWQGAQAYNQVYVPRPTPNNGTFSNVALGATGPIAGSTAATFDGATSWAEIPASYALQSGPGAIGVWFKTAGSGVLVGYQDAVLGATPASGQRWNPALYVGTDGYLHGQIWTGNSTNNTLKSAKQVNDNAWHFAVISADTASSQTLYLDGQATAGPLNQTTSSNGRAHVYIGAGAVSSDWPNTSTTDPAMHLNGQIANVAMFAHGLTASTVSSLYTQATTSGATPAAYDAAVVGAYPTGYWRLNDTSGSTANELLSSAALSQNRGTYNNTTCCATGPWASGTATGAGFNGSTSNVQLPGTAVPRRDTSGSVSVWFKTTAPGVIYGYQTFPLGATPASGDLWNPALYVGTDNKLHGELWNGSVNTTVSATTVTDGNWHQAVLTKSGTTEQLYLDGQASGTAVTTASTPYNGSGYVYLGAGYTQNWTNAPTDTNGHLNGSIADFALYGYALGASTISWQYQQATTAGTTGGLDAASAYRTTVVDRANSYWRLDDPSGSWYASDELGTALPDQASGTYTSTSLGNPGPAGDPNQGSATFNGSTSYLQLPSTAAPTKGPASMELWFKTTTAGVLYAYQSMPLGTAPVSGSGMSWNPALYVGTDSKLHGLFLDLPNGTSDQLTTSQTVTDGNWHQAVLAATANSETLYLDGQQAATENQGSIFYNGTTYVYIGAGAVSSAWPSAPSDVNGHFNGSIAEASYYNSTLDAATVTAHYKAMGNASSPTAMTLATVTDPGGNTLKYRYDARTGQLATYTDAWGNNTSYTYDTSGFLHTVTDADGHTLTTGHDARGNEVSRTTCQNPASCQTSYMTYLLDQVNPYNPTNDKVASSSDARSSGPTDTTFTTTYTYNAAGDLASVTTPNTSDFSKGRTTYTTITAGTEQAVNSSGQPITGATQPVGLVAARSVTVDANTYPNATSLTAAQQTQYFYDTAGNLTKTVTPLGLTTTYTYDNLGRQTSKTESCTNCGQGQTATTSTTTLTWDGQDNPLTQTDPATTDAVTGTVHTRRTTTAYDADSDPTSQTVADTTGSDPSRTTTWTYNTGNDLLAQVTDPAGRKTSYTYDAYGHNNTKTDAVGTTYNYGYSPQGWLQQTAISNYTGDPNNPVTARWQVIEARAYDPAGRLATVTDAMGRTTHSYYNDDNTVAEVDLDGFHNPDGTTRDIVLRQNIYDPAGHLTQRVTGGGKTTVTNAFDAASRNTSTTLDPGGLNRTVSYTFDAAARPLTKVLTDGKDTRETDYTYDPLGDVLSQTVKNTPANSVTTSTYDQRGLPLTSVSPLGNATGASPGNYTTSYTHDTAGNLTTVIQPAVTTDTYSTSTNQHTQTASTPITRAGYDTFGDVTSTDDPDGRIATYTYNADSEQVALAANTYTAPGTTTPVTPTTTIQYDNLGRPTTITVDPTGLNRTTTTTYDQLGNTAKVTKPTVNSNTPTWTMSYDLNGELLSATDPTGAASQATYDDLGRPATSTEIVRQPTAAAYTTTYTYDDASNPTTVTDPKSHTRTATFDAAGEITAATDALSNTSRYTHNVAGALTRTTLPDGSATAIGYDQADRPVTVTHLDRDGTTVLTQTAAAYDVDGNRITATDANGHQTTYTYDAVDQLIQQTQPVASGTSITTSFGHDTAGSRTRYTHTRTTGGTPVDVYYTYNTLGLAESTVEPSTTAYPNPADRTYTTAYDTAGEPVTEIEPGGVTKASAYDADGNLTSQTGTGAETATATRTFGYDLAGRLLTAAAGSTSNTYTYDDRGKILTQSGTAGSATFSYDAVGNLTNRTDKAGTATFGYDVDDRLTTMSEPLTGTQATFQYNNVGELTGTAYGTNTATRAYTYDALGRLTNDTLKNPAGTVEAGITYGYDNDGHLTSKTTTGFVNSGTNTYGYDWAGRLTSWNNGTATTTYGYDNDGNLTQSGTSTSTYDDRDRRLTSGTSTYTYNARGTRTASTTSAGTTSATYDAFDQLITNGTTSYTYDALNRLATTGSTTFNYDRGSDNLTYDGTNTYDRNPDGTLVALTTTTGAAYALSDKHGDLAATYTPTGTTLNSSTSYDPFGQTLATAGPTTGIGYQDNWTDPTTHLTNAHARWYDPTMGAFTSRDTLTLEPTTAATANRYAYISDHPLDATDRSGHMEPMPGGGGSYFEDWASSDFDWRAGSAGVDMSAGDWVGVGPVPRGAGLDSENPFDKYDYHTDRDNTDYDEATREGDIYSLEHSASENREDLDLERECRGECWNVKHGEGPGQPGQRRYDPIGAEGDALPGDVTSPGSSSYSGEPGSGTRADEESPSESAYRALTEAANTPSSVPRPTTNEANSTANDTIVHQYGTTRPGSTPSDPLHLEATPNPAAAGKSVATQSTAPTGNQLAGTTPISVRNGGNARFSVDSSGTATDNTVSAVGVNKQIGDGYSELMANDIEGSIREVSHAMPNGTTRRMDIEAPDGTGGTRGIEMKVGRVSNTSPIRQEIANDNELLNGANPAYSELEWNFIRSPLTGKIGATGSVAWRLLKQGVTLKIHY